MANQTHISEDTLKERAYLEFCTKFGNLQEAKNKDKDPSKADEYDTKLRVAAQDGCSKAKELQDIFEKNRHLAEARNDIANQKLFKEKVDYYAEQVKNWMGWSKKYGSPLSGIPKTTFNDIAGLEDVKETVRNYIFMLNHPDIAEAYHLNTNIGILLYGPPGTGKTLIAEAIAHELNVRYFVITPSQIFSAYVGDSEKNVRNIFQELRACADGSVLLIDECESIFGRRNQNSSRAEIGVANQILQEMNGQGDYATSRRVILGATNRPEMMDEAYLRFKRFSLQFYIGMPNVDAKNRVIDLNVKKRPCEPGFVAELKERMKYDGLYTCADISGIIEQCAYRALTECRSYIEKNNQPANAGSVIKLNVSHLDEVLKTYPRSVTQDMLDEYEAFRDKRLGGI